MAALWQFVLIACLSHLNLIYSSDPGQCERGKFGDGCRFDCHCKLNTACDKETGSCFYGCEPPWMGDGCQIKIFMNGEASQSNTESQTYKYVCDYRHGYHNCYNDLVDYAATNAFTDKKCAGIARSHTYHPSDWWRMDTNGDFMITQLQVNTTKLAVGILVGPSTEVNDPGNRLCATTMYNQTMYTCRPPLRGRYVILKFPTITEPFVELCNVKVQGYPFVDSCPSGYHGSACIAKCQCMMENERCNYVDGSCTSGCSDNYVGIGCDIKFQTNETIMFTPVGADLKITVPEWTELRDSRRGLFQVEYILEIFDETWRVVPNDVEERQFMLRDLKPNSPYEARVILARRSAGNVILRGLPGRSYNFTTPCGVPSAPPEINTVEYEISNPHIYPSAIVAKVSWTPVPEEHVSCDLIDTYKLEYRLAFETEWTSVLVSRPNAYAITVSTSAPDLLPHVLYEFRVVATNKPNLTAIGQIIASKTPEGVAGPVQIIDVKPNSTSAEVRWLKPNETDGIIISYKIQYVELEINDCLRLQDPPRTRHLNSTEVVLEDLKPYRKYNLTISAVTSSGNGPETWRLIETEDNAPESAPTRPSVVGVLAHRARINLYHLACHLRNGRFLKFDVKISNYTWSGSLNTEMTVLDVYNLRPHTLYKVQYSWNNMVASSPLSEIADFTTLTDVPGPPRITDYVTTPRTISLLWKPPSQDYGSQPIYYEAVCTLPGVMKSEARVPAYNMTDGLLYHTFDGGILPSRLYQCKVRAFTPSGAGQWSLTKRLRTTYHNTMPVQSFTVTAGNETVEMTWVEPLITNGILGYKIRCHDGNSTRALMQKNTFLGDTQYVWASPSLFTDLSCEIKTYTPKGDGPTTNDRGEIDPNTNQSEPDPTAVPVDSWPTTQR